MKRMTAETSVEMMVMRCRGMISAMFMCRGIEPSAEQMNELTCEEGPSLRGLAEIAYDLGFHIDFTFQPASPNDGEEND